MQKILIIQRQGVARRLLILNKTFQVIEHPIINHDFALEKVFFCVQKRETTENANSMTKRVDFIKSAKIRMNLVEYAYASKPAEWKWRHRPLTPATKSVLLIPRFNWLKFIKKSINKRNSLEGRKRVTICVEVWSYANNEQVKQCAYIVSVLSNKVRTYIHSSDFLCRYWQTQNMEIYFFFRTFSASFIT